MVINFSNKDMGVAIISTFHGETRNIFINNKFIFFINCVIFLVCCQWIVQDLYSSILFFRDFSLQNAKSRENHQSQQSSIYFQVSIDCLSD